MIHLTPHQISSFLDGELTEASTEIVRLHLASCEECTLAFARAEEQVEQLARVLRHDPGTEYFAGFPSEVEHVILTGEVGSRAKPPATPVMVAAAVAAAPAAAAHEPKPEIEPAARPSVEMPVKPIRAPRRREGDRRPVPAIPWYAAAILVVIAGSAGVMVSRSPMLGPPPLPASDPAVLESAAPDSNSVEGAALEPASVESGPVAPAPVARARSGEKPALPAAEVAAPTSEPAPDPALGPAPVRTAPMKKANKEAETALLVPEPMKSLMPVTRVVTVVETTRTAQASDRRAATLPSLPKRAHARPAEQDPFATLLAELLDRVRAAQAATAHAGDDPTALNYEAAAARWEQVVSDLRGHAAQPRARFQLASARFRAWEMHPDARRAAGAVASLRLYLVFAAPGAERDSAKAWLARLSH